MAQFLVRAITYLHFKLNGLRLRLVVRWLRMQGVQVGKSVYIGKDVTFHVSPGAKLILHNHVTIFNHCTVTVNSGAVLDIGQGVLFNHHSDIACGTHITIGENCSFGPYCTLIDVDHRYRDATTPVRFQGGNYAGIQIEAEVWAGTRAIILRGVHLGKHCVIGAGAVVKSNVPANSLAVGVPAKVVSTFGPAHVQPLSIAASPITANASS